MALISVLFSRRSSSRGRHMSQGLSLGYAIVLVIIAFAMMLSVVIATHALSGRTILVRYKCHA